MLVLFLWVFVEAPLLVAFGTTPGKWLLRTRVLARNRQPFGIARSLERSFGVWFRGLGIGFPLATFFTSIAAYNRLESQRITSWDFDGDFVVTHRKIGILRISVVVLIHLFVIFLMIFAFTQKISPGN